MSFNIVLFSPEIPQNTGNIGRTCVLTNTKLHLIKPLGFEINDKQLKRSGLDYWSELDIEIHESYDDFMRKYKDRRIFIATTKAQNYYSDVEFMDGDFIMFGKESSGLPEYVREDHNDKAIRIPMINSTTRSLNLSNSAAVILYEALRQTEFKDFK